MEYLSKERYEELSAELKRLIEIEYPQIRDELSAYMSGASGLSSIHSFVHMPPGAHHSIRSICYRLNNSPCNPDTDYGLRSAP